MPRETWGDFGTLVCETLHAKNIVGFEMDGNEMDLSNYVNIDKTQTITGEKTFSNSVKLSNVSNCIVSDNVLTLDNDNKIQKCALQVYERVKLIDDMCTITENDLNNHEIFLFSGTTNYTVTIPASYGQSNTSKRFVFRLLETFFTGSSIILRKSNDEPFVSHNEQTFLSLEDISGRREYTLRTLDVDGVGSAWFVEASMPRTILPNHAVVADESGLNYELHPFKLANLKDVDADLSNPEYVGWVLTVGENGRIILSPPHTGVGTERRATINLRSSWSSTGTLQGTQSRIMDGWEDNNSEQYEPTDFTFNASGVTFLKTGKGSTVSGRIRVQGQNVNTVNFYTVTVYVLLNSARSSSDQVLIQNGGVQNFNFSLYLGDVEGGTKINIETYVTTQGGSTATRIYSTGGEYHFMDVSTTFID